MHRFAHMADVHLGAHREPSLQQMEIQAFASAMDASVERGADFILISGDLFHVGIPDLGVVNASVSKMMEVRRAGIPIYAIYGSHDYTPTSTSIIDILSTARVLTNISKWSVEEGKLRLGVTEDERTGAKLAGISARKIGLERKYYEILDREELERLGGFKVFAFHSGITQFKPPSLAEMETVDISVFPKGFDYYAGGHIHQRGEYKAPGYQRIVYPGPLFTGYGKDVELTARGEKRGFYLVEFDDKVASVEFVPLRTFGGVFREVDVGGMNVASANARVSRAFDGTEVKGTLVAFRVSGTLAGGRPSDLAIGELRDSLMRRGAAHVYVNRAGVSSAETAVSTPASQDPAEIENRLFEQQARRVKVSQKRLEGKEGARMASELLAVLRKGLKLEEQKKAYESRMVREGLVTLQLEEEKK
ncbi:MAG: exonuclease SbcCD subunit D [Thaumarchaeota archaeon]|nr:exonuclease SbcCD subunit D [Nitrososphaerota archaeon]